MAKVEVLVTHTIIYRVTVRAEDEVAAKSRAVEVVQDFSLAEDLEIPEEVLNKYDAVTGEEAAEAHRRALRERAARGGAVGEVAGVSARHRR